MERVCPACGIEVKWPFCPYCNQPTIERVPKVERIATAPKGVVVQPKPKVPEPTRRLDEGLSGKQYLLFALLFLVLPAACVIVSSVLYSVWRKDQP
jgi:hypothetical protein